ncbi:ABC transporter permease [Rhodobacter capsulatus]|uniref:hypothetical protein n=1 Tax=Rhodobacter capsulatus TaxID=1061 RepID=UPI0003D35208|nr:hypothetical protein [Rhodobacter capsulatus]ETD88179.1 hypothetical protein U713_15350 [Rhodobacter capsulatus YW2]
MADLWQSLPNGAQDGLTALALLAPAALIGVAALRGYRLGPLLRGLILRQIWTSLIFTALIAVSVALGVGLIAQERGLRRGTAQAAAKFDLVIAAPGSEFTAMLAAVYLQPSDMALIDGPTFAAIADHPEVTLAAPIGFGDSWNGLPTVGTTPQFVAHLGGDLAEGGMFKTATEAVVGARVPLPLGAEFTPEHGLGHDAEEEAHEGYHYRVVGRMALTGTPWDRALLVPVESVWSLHGMGSGHAPDWDGTLGQPFDPQAFPGTPAALVRAKNLAATYALQAEFGTERTMAFFPGTILARLHALMGDIRQGMSVLALLTQALVTAGVLAGLMLLARLLARRLALLRGLGAPPRFILALIWSYAMTLIGLGTALGLGLGVAATAAISAAITARTDILVQASLGWPELHLAAAFLSFAAVMALIPAVFTLTRPVLADLRG